jgi:hypothetical protein
MFGVNSDVKLRMSAIILRAVFYTMWLSQLEPTVNATLPNLQQWGTALFRCNTKIMH